jgi:hypothetical protein
MSAASTARVVRLRACAAAVAVVAVAACTAPVYEDEAFGRPRHETGAGADGGVTDTADQEEPDVPAFCGQPIEPVLEVVDMDGRVFPRDAEGEFLVPIGARSLGLDTGRSVHVTGRRMRYTFRSSCYPTVMIQAPVLVGLSLDGFWLERRCELTVEIADAGCPEARLARAEGRFTVVR